MAFYEYLIDSHNSERWRHLMLMVKLAVISNSNGGRADVKNALNALKYGA